MADVSNGPVSTLPGHSATLPKGAMCDLHPTVPAVARIQGETDSFGCEFNDMCADCLAAHQAAPPESGHCDWCKKDAPRLRSRRDYEEGMSGRVYMVCDACVAAENKRFMAILAQDDDDDWAWD